MSWDCFELMQVWRCVLNDGDVLIVVRMTKDEIFVVKNVTFDIILP
jgi:hypothetical protein